ncbi:MAG: hypothetical protein LAO05_06605 [Acidobacteriia bacterium]|nr:hypothetical protein [Terriglobia bacterium]
MAIRSKAGNVAVLALGIILLAWAASALLEAAIRRVQLTGFSVVASIAIALLGWWCLRGSISNLKAQSSPAPVGTWLRAAVAADAVAILAFVVGSVGFLLLGEQQTSVFHKLGVVCIGGLLAALLAVPFLAVAWLVTARRRANGAA